MTHTEFEEMLMKRFNLKDLSCNYKDDQTAVYDLEYRGMPASIYHILEGSSVIPSPQETDEIVVQNLHVLQLETGRRIVIMWDLDKKSTTKEEWTPVLWGDFPVLLPLNSLLNGNYGKEGLFPALHEAVMVAFNAHHPEAWRQLSAIHAEMGGHDTHYSEVPPVMLDFHEEVGDVRMCLIQEAGQLYRLALINPETKAGINIAVEYGHIQVSEVRAQQGKKVFMVGEPRKEHNLVPKALRTIREWHLSSPEDLSIDFIIDSTDEEEGLGKKYHLDIRATIESTKADSKRIEQLIQEKEGRGEDVSALSAAHARIESMQKMLNRFWTSDIFLNPWLNENWELEFLNHAQLGASMVAEFFGAKNEQPEANSLRNVLML